MQIFFLVSQMKTKKLLASLFKTKSWPQTKWISNIDYIIHFSLYRRKNNYSAIMNKSYKRLSLVELGTRMLWHLTLSKCVNMHFFSQMYKYSLVLLAAEYYKTSESVRTVLYAFFKVVLLQNYLLLHTL